MKNLNDTFFWGNSLMSYIIALGIMAFAILVFQILKQIAKGWVKRYNKRSGSSRGGDLILRTLSNGVLPFLYVVALYIAINTLTLSPFLEKAVKVGMVVVTVFFVVRIITLVIESALEHRLQKEGRAEAKNAMRGVVLIIQVILWVVGLVYLLGNLGYNIATVLAGMGIGGIAIALAAQNILGDIFAYFSILFEKTYEVGDYLQVGSKEGTVTRIGIRSTRIKDQYGEEMLFSNRNILDDWVQNYTRLQTRYGIMGFYISYLTPSNKLEPIRKETEKIVSAQNKVKLDWVYIKDFKDFGIYYEIRFTSLERGFKEYIEKRSNIYAGISRLLEEQGVNFAFNSGQEIFIRQNREKQQ